MCFFAIFCLYRWFHVKQEKVDHSQAETFVALGNGPLAGGDHMIQTAILKSKSRTGIYKTKKI